MRFRKVIDVHVHALWRDLTDEVISLIATFRSRLPELSVSSKLDKTLLTDADTAVQELIIEKIRQVDPHSPVIAEEHDGPAGQATTTGYVWIVDPIDGTAQFVDADAVEFCSVVALYRNGDPYAALIIAPELGAGRTPIVISGEAADMAVKVNSKRVDTTRRKPSGRASVTRSRGSTPSPIETELMERRFEIKTRTTSQTLDMARTALDLTAHSGDAAPFDLFYRRQQKLWDGAAGFCLARAVGLMVTDEYGADLLPLRTNLLAQAEPVLASSLVGPADLLTELFRERP